jgi:hypothetical protein
MADMSPPPTCSSDRPWGLHAPLRSDEDCPRCGWTAPGPIGDSLAFARAAGEAARPLAA